MRTSHSGVIWLGCGAMAAFLNVSGRATEAGPQKTRMAYVSVTDAAGKPVTGLAAADFKVSEKGRELGVVGIATAGAPTEVTVLLDKFVERDTRDVARGIESFAAIMPATCRVSLMSVGGAKAGLLLDHTADRHLLSDTLARLPSLTPMDVDRRYLGGAPQRYPVPEGLRAAVSDLGGASHPSGDILLIATETWIRKSELRQADLGNVRDAGIRLDAVLVRRDLRPGTPGLLPDLGVAMTELFDGGTRSAGGRMETVASPSDLVGVLSSLATELRSRYLVRFSSEGPVSEIRIGIATGHPLVQVRATLSR
jgi:hypothetical protein